MSDHGFSEEQVAVALEHAGPLEEEDLMALAQELELELTDKSRQAQFRRTM